MFMIDSIYYYVINRYFKINDLRYISQWRQRKITFYLYYANSIIIKMLVITRNIYYTNSIKFKINFNTQIFGILLSRK